MILHNKIKIKNKHLINKNNNNLNFKLVDK